MSAVRSAGLVVLVATVACSDARRAPAHAPVTADAATTGAARGEPTLAGDWASPLGDASLYDLELVVEDASGRALPLASLRGAPVVISMFYASCPAACPRLIDDLKGIERDLSPEARARTRFVLVSFDPARDTPAALRQLAEERALGPAWILAAADDPTARELAAGLGVKYRVLDSGEFFHTSVITVLDGEGQPRARVEGLGGDASSIRAALE